MIKLIKGTELSYTPTVDTTLQNTSSSKIYYSQSTYDDIANPRDGWGRFGSESSIVIPANTTWYFYCNSDASMAEVSV